jgi:hypothetical protein
MNAHARCLFLTGLLSAFATQASAGTGILEVTMDEPVLLMVDGEAHEADEASMTYLLEGLEAGKHEISVRTVFNKEIENVVLNIPPNSAVQCRYRNKKFACLAPVSGSSVLKVNMDKPILLVVDGQAYEPNEKAMTYVVDGLTRGNHEVSIRTVFNKEIESLVLDMPQASEVRCRYRKKAFSCYETISLAPADAETASEPRVVKPPAAGTQVVETTTVTTTAGVPNQGIGGGITMTGPDGEVVSVGVNVAGMPGAGQTSTTVTETTTVTQTGGIVAGVGAQAPVKAEPKIPMPTSVSLLFRSTDGEWADVVVDGKVVAEFRNDDEMRVTVKPGSHTIEIREFMEDGAYTRAQINTNRKSEIVIGITEGQPIECYNHKACTTAF